jgi:hypothetical protein
MKQILSCILTAVLAGTLALHLTPASVAREQGPIDPAKEAARKAGKALAEKNYMELKDAALELAMLSKEISDDIEQGGQHVISVRIFDKLDKIEKLTKRIRGKAKAP